MERLVDRLSWMGRVEGTSLLVLLVLAMPLKYFAGMPWAVTVVGSAHGILWIAYLLLLGIAARKMNWRISTVILGGVASVVPLGPWWFETYLNSRTVQTES